MSRGNLEPVVPASRIVEVDMLRGFALFGVLLVNMHGFGADSIAWIAPLDRLAAAIIRFFFESKFWTLFSLLFGFGFAVQLQRAQERGSRITPIFLRRVAVLFAIGAAHALLFDGDILMLYAEIGLLLLVVRYLPPRPLLLLAVGLMLVFPLVRLARATNEPVVKDEGLTVSEARAHLDYKQLTHFYATDSVAEVAADNAEEIPADPLEDIATPESGLNILAMFLLGLSIGRSGALWNIPGHGATIARIRAWGLGFGFAAMAVERVLAAKAGYTLFGSQGASPGVQLAGDLLFSFGCTALAFGYAATLILAFQTPRGRTVLAPLAGVGRLALTVYLTQTLIFTTLFYGYGFGLAYRLGPADVITLAVVIFAGQIVACQWWLKYFRFGPFEWLWRSLTYLEWQPLRLRSKSTP